MRYNSFMRRLPRSPVFVLVEYLLAILLVGLTTGALRLIGNLLDLQVETVLYLLPVGVSTLLWGLGPGIVAAVVAFLAFNFYFIPPLNTLFVEQPQDLLVLIVFLVAAVVLNQLLGRTRAALAAANAREHEAMRLYELSTSLAGQQDDQSIARTLAQYAQAALQPDQVEVAVEASAYGAPVIVHLPPDRSGTHDQAPATIVPLLTVRGLLGEIRLWRNQGVITPAEDRLLKTFASQGALALERARLSRSENRAKVAEESDRLKTALLSSVSHELRTPLAAIKAAVSSLRSELIPWDVAARHELLATIEEETDHLNQLVGNVLEMSRIESGALKPQRKWNALDEIVGSSVARLKPLAQQHRIEIDVPEDLPLLPLDYVQIQQVFINLIGNGIKYAPPHTTICVRAWLRDQQTVQVQVSNQGPPVPEEHLERIFDKFYRVTAADRVTGTGLGLSICKGIVEAHGGRIWAENLPDGFAFDFTLPVEAQDLPPMKMIL